MTRRYYKPLTNNTIILFWTSMYFPMIKMESVHQWTKNYCHLIMIKSQPWTRYQLQMVLESLMKLVGRNLIINRKYVVWKWFCCCYWNGRVHTLQRPRIVLVARTFLNIHIHFINIGMSSCSTICINYFPPPISNLFLISSTHPFFGIGPKHSKRQKASIQRGRKLDMKRLQRN